MSVAAAKGQLYGVILAGGRGTRFWPLSRRRNPKQLLNVVGDESLLQQTVERLRPLIPPERIWILTSELLRRRIIWQLPEVPRRQIIAEPVQRNTAPAIALAAKLVNDNDPEAVIGIFPSDHSISRPAVYLRTLRRAARAAQKGELIVLGIPPAWPETGYGYIELPADAKAGGGDAVKVVSFREKPHLAAAKRYVNSGNFYWNTGQFLWRTTTILDAIARHMPATAKAIGNIAPAASRDFARSLKAQYPRCENLSIDYGVLEKAKNISGFACQDFGWNDVGSWEAVYQVLAKDRAGNVARSELIALDASANYVDGRKKLVALVGVRDLVVVDTPGALLICHRDRAQQVSKIVRILEEAGREELL